MMLTRKFNKKKRLVYMKLPTIPCAPSKKQKLVLAKSSISLTILITKKLQTYTNEVPMLMHFQLKLLIMSKI